MVLPALVREAFRSRRSYQKILRRKQAAACSTKISRYSPAAAPGTYGNAVSLSPEEVAIPEPERIDRRRAALIAYDVCRRALAPSDPARRAAMRPVIDAWAQMIAAAAMPPSLSITTSYCCSILQIVHTAGACTHRWPQRS
jgi:hypothetical protein